MQSNLIAGALAATILFAGACTAVRDHRYTDVVLLGEASVSNEKMHVYITPTGLRAGDDWVAVDLEYSGPRGPTDDLAIELWSGCMEEPERWLSVIGPDGRPIALSATPPDPSKRIHPRDPGSAGIRPPRPISCLTYPMLARRNSPMPDGIYTYRLLESAPYAESLARHGLDQHIKWVSVDCEARRQRLIGRQ